MLESALDFHNYYQLSWYELCLWGDLSRFPGRKVAGSAGGTEEICISQSKDDDARLVSS